MDAALNALSGTGGAAQPGGARSAAQDETRSSRLGRTTSTDLSPLAARTKRRRSGGSQTAWRGLAAHANSSSGAAVDAALNALSGTGGAAQPGGARSAAQDETRSSRLGRTTSTDLSPLAARTSGGAAAEVKRHGAAWPRTPTRAAARRWMPRSTRSAARAVPRNPAAHGAPPKMRLGRRDSVARRAPTSRRSQLAQAAVQRRKSNGMARLGRARQLEQRRGGGCRAQRAQRHGRCRATRRRTERRPR